MQLLGKVAAAAGTAAVLGTAGAAAGALVLFDRVIPRQTQVRVDISEMADMDRWEEYKKIIHPNKEWLAARAMEHVTVKAKDNITLHGDYIPGDGEGDTIAICMHGYTGSGLSDCASIAAFFLKKGIDCLVPDHRAHGRSEGKYIGFGILDRFDCLTWIRYLNSRFGTRKNIILYGVSMGATTALMTAVFSDLPGNVKAIIADCAFTSPYEVFAHILRRDYHLPEFPIMNINDSICRRTAGYGFRDYSTIQAVRKTSCPILFIHGREDNFVPVYMTLRNYQACRSPKALLLVKNAGHAASYYENTPLYEKTVSGFLENYL